MKKKFFLLLLFLNGTTVFYSPIFALEEARHENPSEESSTVESRSNQAAQETYNKEAESASPKSSGEEDDDSVSQSGTSGTPTQQNSSEEKKESDIVSRFSNRRKTMDIQTSSATGVVASAGPYSKEQGSTGLLGGSRISEVKASPWRDSGEEHHDFAGVSFRDQPDESPSNGGLRAQAASYLQQAKEIFPDYKSLVETWGETQALEERHHMLQTIVETQLLPHHLFEGDETRVSEKIKTICSNWRGIAPKDRQDTIARELLNFPESWRNEIPAEQQSGVAEELQDLENRFTIVVLLQECERLTEQADRMESRTPVSFTRTRSDAVSSRIERPILAVSKTTSTLTEKESGAKDRVDTAKEESSEAHSEPDAEPFDKTPFSSTLPIETKRNLAADREMAPVFLDHINQWFNKRAALIQEGQRFTEEKNTKGDDRGRDISVDKILPSSDESTPHEPTGKRVVAPEQEALSNADRGLLPRAISAGDPEAKKETVLVGDHHAPSLQPEMPVLLISPDIELQSVEGIYQKYCTGLQETIEGAIITKPITEDANMPELKKFLASEINRLKLAITDYRNLVNNEHTETARQAQFKKITDREEVILMLNKSFEKGLKEQRGAMPWYSLPDFCSWK